MISYAQNREDVLLQRVFQDREHGFYVDVGAFDPCDGSVTKHFYDKGWQGINIEPGLIFERLRAGRPRDINLNVAVSDQPGLVTFYEHPPDPGTSTLVADLDPALAHCRARRVARSVEAVTLRDVFERYQPEEIDFLKIDVEGHERQVLLGNDWARFRPRVLVIEATLPYSNTPCYERWEEIVRQAGYLFAYFDGLNRFYVRQEDAALLERFAIPVNVLDQHVPEETIRYHTEARHLRSELEEVWVRLKTAETERAQALAEAERLAQEVQHIDYRAQQCEAARSRLQGEVDWLYCSVQHLEEVAQQRELDYHRVTEKFSDVVRQQDAERRTLQAELERVRADQAAFGGGPRPISLRVGLQVARALHRLRHPFVTRRAVAPAAPHGSPGNPGPSAAPGTPLTESTSVRKPMKTVAKACLRPFYRVAKALGQPLAWRLRVFLIQPVLAELQELHALPTLAARLQEYRDELSQRQTELHTQLQQLVPILTQVREQHNSVLQQLASQQEVIRETDRMLLALLKTAQFGPSQEPADSLPRLYRECENL